MKIWKTKNGFKVIKILSGRSNVFLVTNGKKNILVDTSPTRKWSKLDRNLKSFNVSKIDLLILTHTHYDHVENAFRVKKNYGVQVFVHQEEEYFIRTGKNKFPSGTNLFTRFLVRTLGAMLSNKFNFSPCQPDVIIDSVFSLKKYGLNAYLLPTPGHSAGSISLIVDNEIAIVGDALFGVFKNSVFPPFADDIKTLVKSWGKLLETDCSLYLPAHGSVKTKEEVQQEFNRRKNR
ncbi:MAG: MBL fold metallo-hydrolase [Draconibacterium sp.]